MAKADPIITSFVGGEFGASLKGRTDIAQYYAAAEIVENWIIKPSGSIITAPGTTYVSEVKTSSKDTRLIKFVFSRTDAFAIEFGDEYFRFYAQRGAVLSSGTSTVYELAHDYSESEIREVQYAQLNDVIYLTHPNHRPKKLTRMASNEWTYTDFEFLGGPFLDENTDETIHLVCSDTDGTINITVSPTDTGLFTVSDSTTKGHVDTYWKIGEHTITDATTGLNVIGYVKLTHVINSYTATATVMSILSISGTPPTYDSIHWAEGAWSDVRGWPARVAFHERRLIMARTDYQPQSIWGSKPFIYDDFTPGALDDDALNIKLASNEANEIQWLSSENQLIAGTYGGEFAIGSGSNAEPLTPSNISSRLQTSWGSEDIIPLKAGSLIYYIQRFGKKLRELFYFWDWDRYRSADKTILNPEVLGNGVVDIAFQQNPYPIIYCCTTDGTLACLTREHDQEVQAWSRIVSEDGDAKFKSVVVIPSYSEPYDEVWVIVERTINGNTKQYVEYFENIDLPARQDKMKCLHSMLEYDAYQATSSSAVNLSMSATSGTITMTCSTGYFSADDVNRRIRAIDTDGTILGEAKVTSYSSTTLVTAEVIKSFDALSYLANYWGVSVETITGLDHLEAKEVTVLADGGVDKPNETVSAGSITLNYNYFVVQVGLAYTQTLLTLPIEAGSGRGTAQGKLQRIQEIGFKVNRSYKGFKVGADEDSLDQIQFRDPTTLMGTPEALFTGILANIPFNGNVDYGAQIMIQNDSPLPVEILSIMPQLTTFDK